jgi:hypothetical protein
MKFCITDRNTTINSLNYHYLGSFIVHTLKKVDIKDVLSFFNDYGLKIDRFSIEFESNELNSNFIYYDNSIMLSNTLYFFDSDTYGIDNTGVIQRLTGPDYCNFGKRTIFKGVNKSLPSHIYKFKEMNLESMEDSGKRLNYHLFNLDKNAIENIENRILNFHKNIFDRYDKIYMAMSGGLDSRLSFFALQQVSELTQNEKKKISLISYGSQKSEDVRISRKISKIYNLDFELFNDFTKAWPSKKEYINYIKSGNGIGISTWNMIGANKRFNNNECIILGDLNELIVGRKLEISFSRKQMFKFKQKNLSRKEFLQNPKKQISNKILNDLVKFCEMKKSFNNIQNNSINLELVAKETEEDIVEWLNITDNHLLPSQILEYFTLIRYTCPEYRNQIHTVSSFSHAHSISEDINVINSIVCIHPDQRKNGILLDLLFRKSEIWENLLKLPQASAPYLSARYRGESIVNFQKLIRNGKDKIIYRLENIFPNYFASRWTDWREVYKNAEYREMYGFVGDNVEKYIESKSKIGKSQPIPNLAFVNFESILNSISNSKK